ncbi:MAG: Rieske 2Fe-2S domain-containing protein, partial [Planctomycetaceae bacterium]|nr:Rieske 2Fe-2S domain-containing protein [Planctomycetaceae bacterium]
FCQKLLDFEDDKARIVVNAGGLKYAVRRLCPHQGADLTHAWVEDDRYLVCPRHCWRFDLRHGGTCDKTKSTIDAVCLEED